MVEPAPGRPDVLVLGAGGTLGIAWLRGLITGLEEATGLDLRDCEYFVGTSAGAYVGATLAAGHRVADRDADPEAATEPPPALPEIEPRPLRRMASDGAKVAAAVTAPLIPLALTATRPGGAAFRAAVLRAAPRDLSVPAELRRSTERLQARFDGRLRVVAVDRRRGDRVVFGAPGAPVAGVTEAVLASCAVPWVFAPVEIGGREYVDGAVWSPSNLDVAPAGRGSEALALLPTFGRAGRGPRSLARAAARAAGLAELQVLRARGVHVRIVSPDGEASEAMGHDLMNARRRDMVFRAAHDQGRRLGSAA